MTGQFQQIDPLSHDFQILAKLNEASRRVRLLRAAAGAVRAVLVAQVILIPLILLKQVLPVHPGWYLLIMLLLVAAAALFGLLAPLPLLKVARLLDARLDLKDRLQSALEFRDRRDLLMVRALIKDAAAKAAGIKAAEAFPLRVSREARYFPLVVAVAVALLWLPGLPILWLPWIGTAAVQTAETAESESSRETDPSETVDTETLLDPPKVAQRQPLDDLKVAFKDTPFATRPPDFVGFLEASDQRLKLLDPATPLPDLQRDYTQDPFQVSVRRMPEGGLEFKANRVSREEATERMEEFASLWGPGRPQSPRAEALEPPAASKNPKGDDGKAEDQRPDDTKGQEGGPSVRQMEDERTAQKLQEKGDRNVKRYGGGKNPHEGPGGVLPPWLQGPEDPHFLDAGTGEGEGTGKKSGQPGSGHAGETKGPESPRLDVRSEAQLRLRGQLQEGYQDSYDTDLPGLGAKVSSRVPHLEMRAKYSRMAEETLSKEQVPLEYHEQVKRYFSAIERRR